jgi:tetratricopeptide (TPR) repeat protein
MNLEKLKDTARKYEQKEDWRRAIDVYVKAIQEFESGRESAPDLSLYNRVGDLHIKLNDPASAVRSYERAADLYADQGFLNNAIALCGKILRVNPGRVQTYLKLAQLHARKNVVMEAKRNLIEYIERMNALNQLDDAFRSVKSFADQFSANQDIRLMLVELLRAASRDDEAREQLEKMAAEREARGDRDGARATRERLNAIDIELPDEAPAPARANDLIFLDTGFETPAGPARAVPPAPGLQRADVAPAEPIAPAEGFITTAAPELDEPVAPLDLMDDRLGSSIDGLDVGEVDQISGLDSAIAEEAAAAATMLDGLVLDSSAELGVDGPPLEPAAADSLELEHAIPVDLALDAEAATPLELDARPEDTELVLDYSGMGDESLGGPGILPVDQSFAAAEPEDALWHSQEVEADAEVGPTATAPELPYIEGGAPSDVTPAADELEEPATAAVPAPSIVDLEEAVLDDPANPARHRALADALLTNDETERAREEYELALEGYAQAEAWAEGLDAVDALIWLDPESIRFQQKRVELAFRSGDRGRLLDAYLQLGDTLAREGAVDKAVAVYGRVIEHEPDNARAVAAIATLRGDGPAARSAAPPAVPRQPQATAPVAAPSPAPRPSRPAAAPAEPGFVDLGSMILDTGPRRNTRMRVEGERPTGDEQRDFEETLAQFKRGIEENIETDDYEAHYDLGVAFREMGLLDEAIAEFQKALRAPEGRLRTSEALGLTFFDKGQFAIAETILRRAVDGLDAGDDEKIGALYWLGRACEAQEKRREAMASYERALAVDIRFMDLGERVHRLAAGPAQ